MNKKLITGLLPVLLTALTGCNNIREIGQVNGVTLTRVTARGVFSPSSTVIISSSPDKTNEIQTVSAAHGPGVLPAVATAGGIVGGAALLRPARSESNVSAGSGNGSVSATGGTANANGGNSSASGGTAVSTAISTSTATGTGTGTGNGGAGGTGGGGGTAGGHQHPDSPGNGGEPGNGGQNNPH